MPGLVEPCAPHLVHALVIGATERHRRSKPNVEVAEIFESAYQFLGVELGATTLYRRDQDFGVNITFE